ncbi:MAG TPA: hypothetical protein VGH28_03145 [Polyangiaceae bacterium]
MRRATASILFACACGGAAEPVAVQVPEPAPLPSVSADVSAPPPATIAPHVRGGGTSVVVSFAEIRKHPEGARVDGMIRGAPAWRAFPTIDPVRDLDWMTEDGNDMLVRHDVPDAQVDGAIASVAQPVNLGSGLKAWRGVVNHADVVFLRAQPHVVRIAPADHADVAARDLLAHPPSAPTFHAHEAARVRIPDPASHVEGVPDDITEARVWIDSRPADGGADIFAEADCPDAAAAQRDAAAIAAFIRARNTFAVRIVTGGVLNNVEVKPVDRRVAIHLSASEQQLAAVLSLAPSLY